jgi:hypothetical protein
MSRFFQDHPGGSFRLDSPVKVPVASEMPRRAPPHTFEAGEELLGGGRPSNVGCAVQGSHGTVRVRWPFRRHCKQAMSRGVHIGQHDPHSTN